MLVPAPRRKTEAVVLIPREVHGFVLIEDYFSLTLNGMVKRGSGMPMKTRLLPRHKHLQVTGHGQKGVTSVDWVLVFQEHIIVRIVHALFGQLLKCFESLTPLIMVRNSRAFVLQYRLPRRPIEACLLYTSDAADALKRPPTNAS